MAGVGKDDQTRYLSNLLANEIRDADWSQADRELLAYVEKLTRTPERIVEADIGHLRRVGFDDVAIHDACAIAAYYAFVNRIADGLGVDLETHARSSVPNELLEEGQQ